jgi:hypothetical protein
MLDRIAASMLGAAAGAVIYLGFDLLSPHYGLGSGHWSLSGPVKWFALGGAIVGFIGGREIADRLWAHASDELRNDATWTIGTGTAILLFVLVVAAGLYFASQ